MEKILEQQSQVDVLRPPSDEFPPLRYIGENAPLRWKRVADIDCYA